MMVPVGRMAGKEASPAVAADEATRWPQIQQQAASIVQQATSLGVLVRTLRHYAEEMQTTESHGEATLAAERLGAVAFQFEAVSQKMRAQALALAAQALPSTGTSSDAAFRWKEAHQVTEGLRVLGEQALTLAWQVGEVAAQLEAAPDLGREEQTSARLLGESSAAVTQIVSAIANSVALIHDSLP